MVQQQFGSGSGDAKNQEQQKYKGLIPFVRCGSDAESCNPPHGAVLAAASQSVNVFYEFDFCCCHRCTAAALLLAHCYCTTNMKSYLNEQCGY